MLVVILLILFSELTIIFCSEFNKNNKIELLNLLYNKQKQDPSIKCLININYADTIQNKYINTPYDTNFTYGKYIDFFVSISDTNKYIVLPLNEFRNTFNPQKIVIGLRHDIDLDLNKAYQLSIVENNIGVRSSYFVLHAANYYLAKPNRMSTHNKKIIFPLMVMQDKYNHEIGWHNDLITLQLIYKIDPINYLYQELDWLRKNGLLIYGTSSHGSKYCCTYKFLNLYFWKDFKNYNNPAFNYYDKVIVNGESICFKKALLKDFNLDYEAYFLSFNKYYSDASFINGQRWHIGKLNLNMLKPGDRIQILMHPCYYYAKGSNLSEITSFNVFSQKKSIINSVNSTITIKVPYGTNLSSLHANFIVSKKANAWIGNRKQVSGLEPINFSQPVVLKIVAENGLSSKKWTIIVTQESKPLVQ
ncbi:MAG: hypothetical protein HOO91_10205 [Bacteroidales bacterium]|nr:hypothetical protein [Bacteroidales bacterium]